MNFGSLYTRRRREEVVANQAPVFVGFAGLTSFSIGAVEDGAGLPGLQQELGLRLNPRPGLMAEGLDVLS